MIRSNLWHIRQYKWTSPEDRKVVLHACSCSLLSSTCSCASLHKPQILSSVIWWAQCWALRIQRWIAYNPCPSQGENRLNFLASAPFAFQGERRKWEGYHGQCPAKAVPRTIPLSCAAGEDEKNKAPKSEKSGCYPVQDQSRFF